MALQESQTASNANNSITSSTFWVAQTWTTVSAYDITGVRLWLSRAGAFTDDVTISIRATDGSDKPTGVDLATMTFDGSGLTTSSGGDGITRNFDTPYTLSSGVVYAFVVRHNGFSNLRYRRHSSAGYSGGALHTSSDSGGTWGSASTQDWKFEIYGDAPVPTKANTPAPTNGNTSVTLDQATLGWVDGGGADTFNVYYGTVSGSLSLVSSAQAGTSFTVTGITDGSPYAYLSTRYWRIDSTNDAGTTTGDEWSFITIRLDPPGKTYFYTVTGQYYQLLVQGDGSYGDPPGVGVENTDYVYLAAGYEANFISTNRRLVAAAENRFWYEDI